MLETGQKSRIFDRCASIIARFGFDGAGEMIYDSILCFNKRQNAITICFIIKHFMQAFFDEDKSIKALYALSSAEMTALYAL